MRVSHQCTAALLALLLLSVGSRADAEKDCAVCDLCQVMTNNDVQVPALILCDAEGNMMAMDSPVYQQAPGGLLWAKPSVVCKNYLAAADPLAGPTYLLSCLFDSTGEPDQQIFDSGDGAGMFRMLSAGAPADSIRDLIADDGTIVSITPKFIEFEDRTAGLQRFAAPGGASTAVPARKGALRRYGATASSTTHTYISKSQAAALAYSTYRSTSALANFGSPVSPSAAERISKGLARTAVSLNYVRDIVDCMARASDAVENGAYSSEEYLRCLSKAAKVRRAALAGLDPTSTLRGAPFVIAKYAEQSAVDAGAESNRRLLSRRLTAAPVTQPASYGRMLAVENVRLRFKVLELYDTDAFLTDGQFANTTLCAEEDVLRLDFAVTVEAQLPLRELIDAAGASAVCGV